MHRSRELLWIRKHESNWGLSKGHVPSSRKVLLFYYRKSGNASFYHLILKMEQLSISRLLNLKMGYFENPSYHANYGSNWRNVMAINWRFWWRLWVIYYKVILYNSYLIGLSWISQHPLILSLRHFYEKVEFFVITESSRIMKVTC